MKSHWIVVTVVALAVAVIGYYVAINTEWREVTIPMPYRGEAATNPQYAMQTFMRELGADVHSEQSVLSMPTTDAAIILSNWHWDLIDSRRAKLEAWVQAGGRLIVDASLAGGDESFAKWSGIDHRYPSPKKDKDKQQDQNKSNNKPTDKTPSKHDSKKETEDDSDEATPCEELTSTTHSSNLALSPSAKTYQVCPFIHLGWLENSHRPLWSLSDKFGVQVVRIAIGKGSVTLINMPLFDNRIFKNGDHAALTIATIQLHHHDAVWFITESEHASIMSLIWRYGAPVVITMALFVIAALWRNAVRFGPQSAPTDTSRRSLAELIRGSGWFYERHGDAALLNAAVLRALHEAAEKHIRGYYQLAPQKQAAVLAHVTELNAEQLQAALLLLASPVVTNKLHSTRERRRATALIETARRKLTEHKSRHPSANPPSDSEPKSESISK
jgi:hypothetical protein